MPEEKSYCLYDGHCRERYAHRRSALRVYPSHEISVCHIVRAVTSMLMIVGTASPIISLGTGVAVMRLKLSLFFIGVQN